MMSDYTDYADRVAERYKMLARVGQDDVPLEEGYVPLYARCGPWYAVRDLPRVQKALVDARKRARDEQIRDALNQRPPLDLLLSAPLGPAAPLTEVLAQETKVVLLSKAGAGKTTALRYIAAHPLPGKSGELLTIVVDLASLAASGQSLPEYLASDAEQHLSLSLSPAFYENVLWTGQAVLCLDGIDEIAGQDARTSMIKQIESWVDEYPRARFVVTARANAYEPALDRDAFAHYSLNPWSEAPAAELEAAWSEASAAWSEEEVEAQKSQAPRLLQDVLAAREVVSLLSGGDVNGVWAEIRSHLWDFTWRERIALVYRFLSQDHPEAWGRLINRLMDAGLNDPYKLVSHRHILVAGNALAASEISDALGSMALNRVVDGLVDWMTDTQAAGRQEAVDVLFELVDVPYAAECVLQVLQDEEVDDWSREAATLLLAVLGGSDHSLLVDLLFQAVDDAEGSVPVRQAACTSLGHLVSVAALDEELGARVERDLLTRAQDGELPIDVLVALTEALGLILIARLQVDTDLVAALSALARGEGENKVAYSVRMASARVLSALLQLADDARYVEQMWEMARSEDVDDSVRTLIAEMLGRLDEANAQEVAQILLSIVQDPKVYPPGHRAALEAIGRLGYADEALVEALIGVAEDTDRKKTKDFERLAAARALGEIGQLDVSLQHLLMLIADKSTYRTTRNDALALLGEHGLSGDEDLDNAVIAVLQVWVTEWNTTEDVRERAMKSLEMLNVAREDIVRDLISVAQDSRSYSRVRRAAVGALFRLPVEDRDLVVKSLEVPFYDTEEKSDMLRVPIAHLLYVWGESEQGLKYLQLAAEQSYQAMVRYRAGLVLYELGQDEHAYECLLKLATDSSIADPIRCGALRELAFQDPGDEKLADEIKPILREEELLPSVREAVYAAAKSLLAA
jgi:tetratricopeptide (TPR) repeat protein